ncbi:MAG: hypothetical protein H8E98_03825 [Bacteroidetes bacterium]|nr:hypothetical protein [Bacteroidota bacterium]
MENNIISHNSKLKDQLKQQLEKKLKSFILSESFGHRSVADNIESCGAVIAREILPNNYIGPSSKKSTEDFIISIKNVITYVDIKTHYVQRKKNGFSMPNLISIAKLKNLLSDPNNELLYIFINYNRLNTKVNIGDICVYNIYELDWDILRIGSLGLGQLQIKDKNKKIITTNIGREAWTKILRIKAIEYHTKQILKSEREIKLWQ